MTQELNNMYSIRVFCKKKISEPKEWLNDFLEDRVFFDENPRIIQKEHKLEVHYEDGKSPISISLHMVGDAYFDKEVSEIKDVLSISRDSKGKQQVSELINGVVNLILLRMNRNEFESDDDDVWEFLDVLEAYLASEFEGIIHTDDEIFYDKNLRKIYKL